MNHDPLNSLAQLEAELWQAADNLRANSGLASSEYCMPVLGVIFLRHAANRFEAATRQIQEDQAAGRMPRRPAIKADYLKRRALPLPEKARYEYLLALPTDAELGKALDEAMNAIEEAFSPLKGMLPKDYTKFQPVVLENLLRQFNSEALRTAGGDVFGRIYEYFLMKFAMQGAQDNGEFFTPPSLVQTIVNVIEPDHGVILDPACGSGGMFVQTSHFIERRGQDTAQRVTFYGQEKTRTTIPLARMNLAVHGLEGDIKEANTYYQDAHTRVCSCYLGGKSSVGVVGWWEMENDTLSSHPELSHVHAFPFCRSQRNPPTTHRCHHEPTATHHRTNRTPHGRTRCRCAGGTGVRRHRYRVPRCRTAVGQRGPASQSGQPEKKGYVGCSVTCPLCTYAAKFHSYQSRRLLTVHGEVRLRRAYYYCGRCHQSYLPYDEVLGLQDEISPGLLPLVCLAGTLLPFADASEDVLQRFAGVRLSASTVLRRTEGEGERLRAQLKEGRMVEPTQPELKWTTPRKEGQPAAYVGLDAFSVPMQGIGAGKAEHRMLYTALLYTPDKEHTRYLVDFELDALAEQVRWQARALGVTQVSDLIAVTDGGNGLEEALQRHLADNLTTILDWYHAAEHLCDFAKVWHAGDEAARSQWSQQAKDILYEQGGEALLTFLHALELPARTSAEVGEELRKLIGYFENNRHRTDYPRYRQKDWDIGSGPTEAGCKIIGERLKGSGMRWVEDGAATVAALRALYVSGGKVWDGFWSQPHRAAA